MSLGVSYVTVIYKCIEYALSLSCVGFKGLIQIRFDTAISRSAEVA